MRITLYDFGKIVVDGEAHTRDVIIHPGRVEGPWWRREGHLLAVDDLAGVWDSGPDTLVIGTGFHGNMVVPEETAAFVRSKGAEILNQRTPDAVATFNRLVDETEKRVVAALHLTC